MTLPFINIDMRHWGPPIKGPRPVVASREPHYKYLVEPLAIDGRQIQGYVENLMTNVHSCIITLDYKLNPYYIMHFLQFALAGQSNANGMQIKCK